MPYSPEMPVFERGSFPGASHSRIETPAFDFHALDATVPDRAVPRHTHESPELHPRPPRHLHRRSVHRRSAQRVRHPHLQPRRHHPPRPIPHDHSQNRSPRTRRARCPHPEQSGVPQRCAASDRERTDKSHRRPRLRAERACPKRTQIQASAELASFCQGPHGGYRGNLGRRFG